MKLKLLAILFISQWVAIAQNSGTLTGVAIDNALKQPMAYVNVSIFDNDKLVTGGITNENGIFVIKDIPLKKVKVEITFIGYKKIIRELNFSENSKSINLNTIALEEDAIQLKGVEIISERSTIEQKIDRKVINIGKDIIASGNTASDILNNVPTVSVDAQTKEISLRGNSNVKILIDGKPSNIDAAQLLQQIPSSSIKQIELITNPSAKYNPEGMSGIINIILHKNSNEGFNGSINSGVTFGRTPKINTALNLNYKVGKVNFYTNYGLNHGKNNNYGFIESEKINNETRQDFNATNKNTSHLVKFGIDYYMDEKNTFSVYTNQNISRSSGGGLTTINYINPAFRDSDQFTNQHTKSNTQTYDFVYKHDFAKKDETLDFQANYSNTDNPDESTFDYIQENPFTNTITATDIQRDINYLQLNVDYVNPLTESVKLEVGAETRHQNIKNNLSENVAENSNLYNQDRDSNFDFTRNIHSFYTNIGKQWEKWSAQIGVRLEQYEIDGDFTNKVTSTTLGENINDNSTISDKIFSVYPSLFFNYKATDKDSYNFNYSRRVDRPGIGQISPIREWSTPLVESRGNPSLEPQFTNSFEVNYTRIAKIGSITSGVFYRQINDEIGRVIYRNPSNIAQDILSYDNFENNHAVGVEVSANLKFAKWWSVNASTDAYFKTVKGTVENGNTGVQERGEVDVTVLNIRMSNNFVATKDLRFNLFGMYRGKDLGLQYERAAMYKMDIGTTYNILKGRGSITARLNDVFDTFNFAFNGEIPYRQQGQFNWESRTVYLGFNYNFGGGKNKALQRKQRDANETQSSGGMI